jgi:hypothetical protein
MVYIPDEHTTRAIGLGLPYGVFLGFYWTTQYAALVQLLPSHKIGKFTGVFPALKNLVSVIGPIVYAAIVQRTNDHRIALPISIVPSFALSLVPLRMIDFPDPDPDPDPAISLRGSRLARNISRRDQVDSSPPNNRSSDMPTATDGSSDMPTASTANDMRI